MHGFHEASRLHGFTPLSVHLESHVVTTQPSITLEFALHISPRLSEAPPTFVVQYLSALPRNAMQEAEPHMSVPGHASNMHDLSGSKQEADTGSEEVLGVELENQGYLRGWKLHLLSLRFVWLFDFFRNLPLLTELHIALAYVYSS